MLAHTVSTSLPQEDSTLKTIKNEILFSVANNILPVIYWYKLRQKMAEFLEPKKDPEELETKAPPTHAGLSTSKDFLNETNTPEGFLNYFKSLPTEDLENFIEKFLLHLIQEEDVEIFTEDETSLYLALQNYFIDHENINNLKSTGPLSTRKAKISGYLEPEKIVENNYFDSSGAHYVKASPPFVAKNLNNLNTQVKLKNIENPKLKSIQAKFISSPVSPLAPEKLIFIQEVHELFKSLQKFRYKLLNKKIANRLGFPLRAGEGLPNNFNYLNLSQAKYLMSLIDYYENQERKKISDSPSIDKKNYPQRLKAIFNSKAGKVEFHLSILFKLKKEIAAKKATDTVEICATSCYQSSPEKQSVIDFWFPDTLSRPLETRAQALEIIDCVEESLLLINENSSFISSSPLIKYDKYKFIKNQCNLIKNKNIKDLLLKLIEDIPHLNMDAPYIPLLINNIWQIILNINTWLSSRENLSNPLEPPLLLAPYFMEIKFLFPRNTLAQNYLERVAREIDRELTHSEPSFESNPIINHSDKKIVSYGTKIHGISKGLDITLQSGKHYTIKQGSRNHLLGLEISIGNTLAEFVTAFRLRQTTLPKKTIASAYYLIKQDNPAPENKEIVTGLQKNLYDPYEVEEEIIIGLKKHLYVASEWSTDYLSIKACALFGYRERPWRAGSRHPELFEALRILNNRLKLGLENIFFAGVFPADFDLHTENFLLKFDIQTLRDPSHRTYALYLINNLKSFLKKHQLSVKNKIKYIEALTMKIKKIQALGVSVNFHKFDHDSGFYRFCDYANRSITFSDHHTPPVIARRRWGIIAQPTCHLTELLVGKNPNLLLLSAKSIEILQANEISQQLQQNEKTLATYFLDTKNISKSKTLAGVYGNPTQIRYILLDKFYAHITGEPTQLPVEFGQEERILENINKGLEKKILYRVKEATIHRAYDIQQQYLDIVNQKLNDLKNNANNQLDLQKYQEKLFQFEQLKDFLEKELLYNRAELLYHSWDHIQFDYQKTASSSNASQGILTRIEKIYSHINNPGENTSELKLHAYLQVERYLQADDKKIISRKLAKTILRITHHRKKRPFFRRQNMTSMDPYKKDQILHSLTHRLNLLSKKIDCADFKIQKCYYDLLKIINLLLKIARLSVNNQDFVNKVGLFYSDLQKVKSVSEFNSLLIEINPSFHSLENMEEHKPLHYSTPKTTQALLSSIVSNVRNLPIITEFKKRITEEKMEVIDNVLEQIKKSYYKRVGFFCCHYQSTASRTLLSQLSKNNIDKKTAYSYIANYLNSENNRNRRLAKIIMDYTGWYHPEDIIPTSGIFTPP